MLGGSGAATFRPRILQLARETLRDSLGRQASRRSWSLTAALIDPDLRVFPLHARARRRGRVLLRRRAADAGRSRGVGTVAKKSPRPAAVAAQRRAGRTSWVWRGTRCAISPASSRSTALENELVLAEPGWADYLIDALASPGRGLAAAVDRRRGAVRRAAGAGHRHRRIRGRRLLPAVLLEQAPRRHGRLARSAAVRRRRVLHPARDVRAAGLRQSSAWAAGC